MQTVTSQQIVKNHIVPIKFICSQIVLKFPGNLVDTVYYDVEVEEDEDEEINGDDLLIDMNMFMNGTQ